MLQTDKKEMIECNCDNCELKDLFFENVSKDEIQNLCTNKVEKNFTKGDFILQKGDEIKEFIYLKSGLVKLYIENKDRKEQIIYFAKPFDFVSILSVFSGKQYNYSVKAVEESVTCNIEMGKIKKLVLSNGKFSLNLLERMSKVSDKVILESLEIRRRNLKGRVAYILLYFYENIYHNLEFELPVSRKEIAEYIGKTTENVIRALTEFRKDGLIKIYGKVVEISDLERLKQVSLLG